MAKKKKPVVLLFSFNHPELVPLVNQCPKLRVADAWAWFLNSEQKNRIFERQVEVPIPEEEDAAFAALSSFGHAVTERLLAHIGDSFLTGYHPNASLSDVEASFRADGFEPVQLTVDSRRGPRPAPKWPPISHESPRRRLEALIAELEKHEQLRVVKAEIRPAPDPGVVHRMAQQLGLKDGVLRLYEECDGAEIRWKARRGKVAGSINLVSCAELFGDWSHVHSGDDAFRPVDFFEAEQAVGLLLDGAPNPCVAYAYLGESITPLGFDFDRYFELLLASRGLSGWHAAMVADIDGEKSTELGTFCSTLPKLFPDVELAAFVTRDTSGDDARELAKLQALEDTVSSALKAAKVSFDIEPVRNASQRVNVRLLQESTNLERAVAALQGEGIDLENFGDPTVGSKMIGALCVDKVAAL